MGATYAKLQSGEWGVRTSGLKVSKGVSVTVEKRDGSKKVETIARVLWSDGDATICAIERAPIPRSTGRRRPVDRYEAAYYSDGVDGCGGDS